MTVGSDTLNFTYDASGRPLSVTLNGTTYYYVTNLQGDVTAILNTSGTAVVNYTYDAWGNPLTTSGDLAITLGTLNPLRYRGYVYDTETGLYYLQSRYYDPQIGRFINADGLVSTGQGILGNNMFAYCGNNPAIFSDPTGDIYKPIFQVQISDGGSKQQPKTIPETIYTKKSGLINGQAILPYSEDRISWGTYGQNGCGIIAIYNAMQLLGYHESLATIESEVFLDAGYLAGALLGIKWWKIDDYFSSKNISCDGYSSYSTMLQNISDGDIIVFMVMNDSCNIFGGYHYMTAQYIDGNFVVYNISSYSSKPGNVSTLDPVYGNSKWCYGYVVGG